MPTTLKAAAVMSPLPSLKVRMDDLDLGHRSELDAKLVLRELLLGLCQRAPLDLDLLDRGSQVPITNTHLVDDVGDLRGDLDVGNLALDLLRLQRRPLVVGPAP